MVEVYRNDFYEFQVSNGGKIVKCEDCRKEMQMPEPDNVNADMEEPFFIQNRNVFYSYCEYCFSERLFEEADRE